MKRNFLDVEKKFLYMVVLTDCGRTQNAERSVQPVFTSPSTSKRGSEDDMIPSGSNSLSNKSEPGKKV